MKAALVAVLAVGCTKQPPPLSSCDESLAGVWLTETGDAWMLLEGRGEQRGRLEGFPLFDDIAGVTGSEVSPRAMDLVRDGGVVRGEVTRRYMRGAERCDQKAPVVVRACRGSAIEVEHGEITPPTSVAPCTAGLPGPIRHETWRRR